MVMRERATRVAVVFLLPAILFYYTSATFKCDSITTDYLISLLYLILSRLDTTGFFITVLCRHCLIGLSPCTALYTCISVCAADMQTGMGTLPGLDDSLLN